MFRKEVSATHFPTLNPKAAMHLNKIRTVRLAQAEQVKLHQARSRTC